VAVLGLGEAGGRYARDLLATGATVTGYDPVADPGLPALRMAGSPAEAVAGAGVVLGLTGAGHAEEVAGQAAGALTGGTVYADLNTASPSLKRAIAIVVEAAGARFADVAVLAPVPRLGLLTPLAVSGSGRRQLTEFLAPLGVPVEDAGTEPGAAAARKMLRSIFMKGLAASVLEALEAAELAGQGDWLRGQIVDELAAADPALVDRLVAGTQQHAVRRLAEMRAVLAYLAELGAGDHVTRATVARLADLCDDRRR
jgi:3-hydroxyisobutyrate dehydrogenase-like beta-hydroxyacid dehydrogenase